MMRGNHRFIRGNHDNPAECQVSRKWIADGHVENDTMFIGGAVSIDRVWRQEGYNWWPDEELSITPLNILVDRYLDIRPRIMVTHDCPEEVAAELARLTGYAKLDPQFASRSRQAFQSMWSAHSPELWIFGHWHHSFHQILRGTRFICLAELECSNSAGLALMVEVPSCKRGYGSSILPIGTKSRRYRPVGYCRCLGTTDVGCPIHPSGTNRASGFIGNGDLGGLSPLPLAVLVRPQVLTFCASELIGKW